MALKLPRLQRKVSIVDKLGAPALAFHQWWQSVATAIENAIASIQGNTDDIANTAADVAAANAALADAAVSLASLDARIDAYDALGPLVQQDQAAAPAYTAYAGQTVGVAYSQAQAQATDDAVKALAAKYAALVTALQTANVLT